MARAIPVDLDLAAAGYLKTPDGRLRFVWGLDRIVTCITQQGGRLYWSADPLGSWALTLLWSRVVVFDAELIEEPPWRIRSVFSEECAHLVVGRSELRADAWRIATFQGLIEPAWV